MFLSPIKLDRMSFETKGQENFQKTVDFVIESTAFCPFVPPSWISLVGATFAMYASAIYVSYIYETARMAPEVINTQNGGVALPVNSKLDWNDVLAAIFEAK